MDCMKGLEVLKQNKNYKENFTEHILNIFQYPCSAGSNLLVKEDSKISSTKSNLNLNNDYVHYGKIKISFLHYQQWSVFLSIR